jgi:post-segregation antitoxin (ccd killing protein)
VNSPSQSGANANEQETHNVVLYLDKDLVEKSRNIGFNLSETFENHLKQLITHFSQVNSVNKK